MSKLSKMGMSQLVAKQGEVVSEQAPIGSSNEGKWFNGITAENLNQLSTLADEVNQTIEVAVVHLVRCKMRIGRALNAAREIFPGDKEFGQWRAEVLPNISKTEATYCMKAEKTFRSAPELIEKMGWSTMRELSYAPKSLVDKIIENPEEAPKSRGEAVAAKKAITEAKPEPKPVPIPGEGKEPIKIGKITYPLTTIEERWTYYLSLPLRERVERSNEYDNDFYVILGLSPDTEIGAVSKDVLTCLAEMHKREFDDSPKLLMKSGSAIASLKQMIKESEKMVTKMQYGERMEIENER